MAAAGPIARHCVFERVAVPTSFKSAADNLPASCMFVVVPRRQMLQAQGLYTEGERSSSVEPLCFPGQDVPDVCVLDNAH